MRKFVLPILVGVGIFALALVSALSAGVQGQSGTEFKTENPIDVAALFPLVPVPKVPVPDIPLPKSLDNLFPPKAPGPIWFFEMLG